MTLCYLDVYSVMFVIARKKQKVSCYSSRQAMYTTRRNLLHFIITEGEEKKLRISFGRLLLRMFI